MTGIWSAIAAFFQAIWNWFVYTANYAVTHLAVSLPALGASVLVLVLVQLLARKTRNRS